MRAILFFLVIASGIISCSGPREKTEAPPAETSEVVSGQPRLEVYCFHGTRQCETCKNMKANTASALKKYFKSQLLDSTIVFSIVDVDDEKNAALAEKFEATGTALMVNYRVNGKDSILDWSDFAFEKANDPQPYEDGLKTMIENLLSQK